MKSLSRSSLESMTREQLIPIAHSVAQNRLATLDRTEDQIHDWRWRLNNLYWIVDEAGQRVKFEPNAAQVQFLKDMHTFNIILKARQLGFSTLWQILQLDAAVFVPNISCGTIAQTRNDAEDIFEKKTKFPYENLPDQIKAQNPATQDAARHLKFANNSSIRVGTSLRSATMQYLHVSEYGKICAQFPEKAREIRTGALNTVHAGQMICIESTAEGQEGDFFKRCERAKSLAARGVELSPLDFRLHFFPWYENPKYVLDAGRARITAELEDYFEDLETQGISLTEGQKAWYAIKQEDQEEDMYREFPSTADEAFRATVEGAYYGKLIRKAEEDNRIGEVPHDASLAVETWWDLGLGANDAMNIWFVQRKGVEYRVIDHYHNSGEGLGHYAHLLQDKQQERGFTYSRHIWPHDGNTRILDEKGRTREQVMADLGYLVEIVPRGLVATGIQAVRDMLPFCHFDVKHCEHGLKNLRMYRKKWNEDLGTWYKEPLHDDNSHAADAFRTGAMYEPPRVRRKGQRLGPKVAVV